MSAPWDTCVSPEQSKDTRERHVFADFDLGSEDVIAPEREDMGENCSQDPAWACCCVLLRKTCVWRGGFPLDMCRC